MPAAARLASLDESVARGMRGSPRLIPVKVVAPRSSFGSASNAVALQVGGALGVAVIGSVLSTRYQDHMTAALAGRHLPRRPSLAHSAVPSPWPLTPGAPPAPCWRIPPAPRS